MTLNSNKQNKKIQFEKNLYSLFNTINKALVFHGFGEFKDNFLKQDSSNILEDDLETNISVETESLGDILASLDQGANKSNAEDSWDDKSLAEGILSEKEKDQTLSKVPFSSTYSSIGYKRKLEFKKRIKKAGGVFIMTEEEKTQVKWFLEQEPDNPYFQFLVNCVEFGAESPSPWLSGSHDSSLSCLSNVDVASLPEKPKTKEQKSTELYSELQIHHIFPKYLFKKSLEDFYELPFNLIVLNKENHIRAHSLLYELYGDARDASAIQLLEGNCNEAVNSWRQAGGYATQRLLRARGSQFYDPVYQQKMGRRSLARPDALEIRSVGGKKGGRNSQIGRIINKEDRYVFSRRLSKQDPVGVEVLCVFNCETGHDVLKELNKFSPTNLGRATPLLTGQRKWLHNWSCKKIEKVEPDKD